MHSQGDMLLKLLARRDALAQQIEMMKGQMAEAPPSPSLGTLQGNEKTMHHSIAECEGGLRELDRIIAELKESEA